MEETTEERCTRQFNESIEPSKPILDIVTLKAMYPQHADWLEEEAKERSQNDTCNCGNCLMVALHNEFDVEYPDHIGAYRLGWPTEIEAYPEGWGKLNRNDLNKDGSGWEIG